MRLARVMIQSTLYKGIEMLNLLHVLRFNWWPYKVGVSKGWKIGEMKKSAGKNRNFNKKGKIREFLRSNYYEALQ